MIENKIQRPICLDIRIEDTLADAIQKCGVTSVRLIVMDDSLFSVPDLEKLKAKAKPVNDITIDPS